MRDFFTSVMLFFMVCVNLFCCVYTVETGKDYQRTIEMQKDMIKKMELQNNKGISKCSVEKTLVNVRVTHYSAEETGSTLTASGRVAEVGRTVACNFLPLGTHVVIDGHHYVVDDTGGMGENVVDVFVNSTEEALSLGTYHTVMEVL